MKTVSVLKARTPLSKPVEQACCGDDIVIAHGSDQVVPTVGIEESKGDRQPGSLRGKIRIAAEMFEPLPPEKMDPRE